MLKDKTIILGVTGGIAAYKAADLASKLAQAGATVRVVMTKAAREFIQPMTFEALTGYPVVTEMFGPEASSGITHINLADNADIVLIAPATANVIAKIAGGIADDMLTCVVLATKAPVVVSPAMHNNMYISPVTQENIEKLKKRGILTFTGMMLGLDEDTPEYFESVPKKLDEVDPSSVLFSISIPIPGTPFHKTVEAEGRLFDRDLSHYEGDHLVFWPRHVNPGQVFEAFRKINKYFYSWKNILKRWWRLITKQSLKGNLLAKLFHTAIISVIFFKLSVFQRDHAQKRVYPMRTAEKEFSKRRESSALAA